MKGFFLILTIVMNGGSEQGGAAIYTPPIAFETMADCQAAAAAYIAADGSWSNHRAACVGRNAVWVGNTAAR